MWFMGGDFSDITGHEEKMGGMKRSNNSFEVFRDFIKKLGMREIISKGKNWTWVNNRQKEGYIEEKLDRFFGVWIGILNSLMLWFII